MKQIQNRLRETLYELVDIKLAVRIENPDDEEYSGDIIEELDNALDAIRGAIALI